MVLHMPPNMPRSTIETRTKQGGLTPCRWWHHHLTTNDWGSKSKLKAYTYHHWSETAGSLPPPVVEAVDGGAGAVDLVREER